jgi:hypothetical protein
MHPETGPTLIEIRQEWVCRRCGRAVDFPTSALSGLTLKEIIERVKALREEALAEHVCTSP